MSAVKTARKVWPCQDKEKKSTANTTTMTSTKTIDLTFNIFELIGCAITKAYLLIQSDYRFFLSLFSLRRVLCNWEFSFVTDKGRLLAHTANAKGAIKSHCHRTA